MRQFHGTTLQGTVVSLHVGGAEDLSKAAVDTIQAELGGFAGDSHAGPGREAYEGDWEPPGTWRRNERQFSAVSEEELEVISRRLQLTQPLRAGTLGANLCLSGIPDLSLLPRGTRLVFPSGAVLLVEEYNPPCADMGAQIAAAHRSSSGEPLSAQSWLRPAAGRRGIVGVIDVPGEIVVGDSVTVQVFEAPVIRQL